MTDQRCGTCKWWGRNEGPYDGIPYSVAYCDWPRPFWVNMGERTTPSNQGTDCPVWEEKPGIAAIRVRMLVKRELDI